MNIFDRIKQNNSQPKSESGLNVVKTQAGTTISFNSKSKPKTTAGVVGQDSAVCPVCQEPLALAYSKGIPVKVCVKHNISLPEITNPDTNSNLSGF